jgi:hypothetical protein
LKTYPLINGVKYAPSSANAIIDGVEYELLGVDWGPIEEGRKAMAKMITLSELEKSIWIGVYLRAFERTYDPTEDGHVDSLREMERAAKIGVETADAAIGGLRLLGVDGSPSEIDVPSPEDVEDEEDQDGQSGEEEDDEPIIDILNYNAEDLAATYGVIRERLQSRLRDRDVSALRIVVYAVPVPNGE